MATRSVSSSLIAYCAVLLLAAAGCNRDEGKVILKPPFDAKAKVGEVTASWQPAGEERAFAEGRKLAAPQVRMQYQVNVRNRLSEKMFVRLSEFRLTDEDGVELGKDAARVDCVLRVGDSTGVLRGEVWVAKDAADDVSEFAINHFVVPLSEVGQGHYREWVLQGRKGDEASVDAEIVSYAAAPACPTS